MSAIVLKYLDALQAQMQLGLAQIEIVRHAVMTETTPTSAQAIDQRPERCKGVADRQCGLMNLEARSARVATFGAPNKWRCVGCQHEED